MAWTDERIALLKKLYVEEGLSASQIADRIGGVSRNAVIGKVTRLGWVKGVPEQTKRARARVAIRVSKPAAPKPKPEGWFPANLPSRALSPEAADAARARSAALDAQVPPEARRKLVDLEPQHCRFPLGEPGTPEFGFCPNDRVPGIAYCAPCSKRAFDPVQPARRPVGGVHRVKAPANDMEPA